MTKRTKMIRKVAGAAKKTVLLGMMAAMGSLVAYASETAEKAGPAIEKAKMETVKMDMASVEALVLAGTVRELNVEFAQLALKKAEANAAKLRVMKEPVEARLLAIGEANKVDHFNASKKPAKLLLTKTYYYISNTTDDANLPGSWTDQMPTGHSCGLGSFPCEVTLDAEDYPVIEDFIDGRNAAQVAADSRIDRTSEPAQ